MSGPSTTNSLAQAVNDAIMAGFTAGESAVEAILIADQPWLGLPVIKQLLEWILGKLGSILYAQAADGVTKVIIDLQVGEETSAVNQAFTGVQQAIASGDQNAIQRTKATLDSAFGNLINYDGSTPT